MLGPLIELDLVGDCETVPEGLKIAPVHFLSAPTDELFRNITNVILCLIVNNHVLINF